MSFVRSTCRMLLAAGLAAPGAAWAAEPTEFYHGKTIRLIVGYSPGGGYDTNARIFAKYFGNHIPGHPTVVVENMPGASSLKSVQYLNAAPKDGTIVTAFSAGLVLQSQIDPTHFPINLTEYSWLGSIGQEVRVCYMRKASGVKTWPELLARPHVTFGETGTGSAGYIDQSIMRTILGAHLKTILGYPGSAEKVLAVDRGELDGDCVSFTSIPPAWVRDDKINIIYRSTNLTLPGMPKSLPYIMDLAKTSKDKQLIEFLLTPTTVGRPYVASKDVPADRLALLRAGFDETVKDPTFVKAAEAANLAVVGPMSADEASKFIARAYSVGADTIKEAKAITGN